MTQYYISIHDDPAVAIEQDLICDKADLDTMPILEARDWIFLTDTHLHAWMKHYTSAAFEAHVAWRNGDWVQS